MRRVPSPTNSLNYDEPDHCDEKLRQKVVINVGGQRFTTFQFTLKRVPNSRLAELDTSDPSYDAQCQEYFFDRSPKLFEPIMDFYRTGELHMPHCLCGPAMKKELDYWGIEDSSFATCCWRAYKKYDYERHTLKVLEKALDDKVSDDENEDIPLPSSARESQVCKRPQWIKRLWKFLDKPQSSKAAQVNRRFRYKAFHASISTCIVITMSLILVVIGLFRFRCGRSSSFF